MKKILIIEDDENLCRELADLLTNSGYEAAVLKDFSDALGEIRRAEPDLILLDINIPVCNGEMLLKDLRKESDVPVIMVTSRSGEADEVLSMSYGADDYITKPFGNSELLARIRTALRHTMQHQTGSDPLLHPYHHGGLTIDFEKRLVTRDETDIHLTQNEYKIVALLAQNSGRVLTYDKLIEYVWGPYSENDNTSLRVHMANIRRKLEPNPAEPIYLFTEIGVGYRMAEEDT